jgi:CubicO group peptidase (beta-lactamase class C family)
MPCALAQDLARMDQLVKSYVDERKNFMGSVLVARGDDVLMSRAYGSADLEWDIANTPETRFRIGSLTKQFTAAAILLLEERGKLRVDDPVKMYLPDAPAAWDRITVFHLLTHTSGIPNFTAFPEYGSLKVMSTTIEKIVSTFRDKPLEFPAGEKFAYTSSGYLLLGYLIEKLGGQTYEQFVQDNIFTPLGMNDSGYDSNSRIILRRAAGYSHGSNGLVNTHYIDMSVPHAAGGLYSTTGDLLRWTRGLFGGKLLSPTSLAKMQTPFKNNFAMGLVVRAANGRRLIEHGGQIDGFNAKLDYYPETGLVVAVLANLNGPGAPEIARNLAAIVHGEPVVLSTQRKEIALSADVLARYTGTYDLTPTLGLIVTLVDGQLMVQFAGHPRFPLFAESETRFFVKIENAQLEFVKDAAGDVAYAILHRAGRDQKAVRRRTTDR